jgi:hypothetical protein
MNRRVAVVAIAAVAAESIAVGAATWLLLRSPSESASDRAPTRQVALDAATIARASDTIARIDVLLQRFNETTLTVETPANDLVHALLAHGGDFEILDGESRASCLDWLLSRATIQDAADGRPIIHLALGGWSSRRGSPIGESNTAEAHFAQFLFYLSEAKVDPHLAIVALPDRTTTSLDTFVDSIAARTSEGVDLSYVLPLLLRWAERDEWSNRFGKSWDFDRLLSAHLEQEGSSKFCGGAHWMQALAFALRGDQGREISHDLRQRAEQRLNDHFDRALTEVEHTGWYAVPFPDPTLPIRFSYQSHVIEWMILCIDDRELLDHEPITRAIARLILELTERWELYPFRDVCHAIRAARLVRNRLSRVVSAG